MSLQIYLINLDHDKDRLAWMDKQLKHRKIAYERFSAWMPKTVPDRLRSRFHKRALDVMLPNNIASFASHLSMAELLLESNNTHCLVLEDDVEILCSFEQLEALGQISRKFDILKLSDWPKCATLQLSISQDYRIVRYLYVPRGAGSYFLSRRGAEKLLERALNLAITTDNFMRAEAGICLDIAGVVPPPIPQDRFGSSSIDPTKQRSKAKRQHYFYKAQRRFDAIYRNANLLDQVGIINFARLWISHSRMKLNKVKKDTESQFVLSTKDMI